MATKILSQDIATLDGNIAMGSNKITGLANGTASTDAAAFNQIPACVSTSTTTASNTNGTTYVDATNLTATITPKSSSNKVLVTGTFACLLASDVGQALILKLQIIRGASTVIIEYPRPAGVGLVSAAPHVTVSFNFLDSPATTSAIAYKIQFARNVVGGTGTIYCNDGNSGCAITLLEIPG